ncbi:hypothetical protein NXY03_13455 [Bacteroides fragilis]|nr:hypothetical protein NXY03_13455 [Bacteroides fragilis]
MRSTDVIVDELYNWYTTSCATGDVRVVQLVMYELYNSYVPGCIAGT